MPTVGKKKFAYTSKGEAQAKSYAKKTGEKMTVKKSAAIANTKKTTTPKGTSVLPSQNTPAAPLSGPAGFQMPPEPTNISSQQPPMPPPIVHPLVPMSPGMISSIRRAPTGKVPAGLAKWMQAHGKAVK